MNLPHIEQQISNALIKQYLFDNGFCSTYQQFRSELIDNNTKTSIGSKEQLLNLLHIELKKIDVIEQLIMKHQIQNDTIIQLKNEIQNLKKNDLESTEKEQVENDKIWDVVAE